MLHDVAPTCCIRLASALRWSEMRRLYSNHEDHGVALLERRRWPMYGDWPKKVRSPTTHAAQFPTPSACELMNALKPKGKTTADLSSASRSMLVRLQSVFFLPKGKNDWSYRFSSFVFLPGIVKAKHSVWILDCRFLTQRRNYFQRPQGRPFLFAVMD